MNKREKIKKIQYILNTLYPNPPIPLQHHSDYTLLIAVLLSARCTDKQVNKITPVLFKKADTPEKMLLLQLEDIQTIIRPCGLSPQKAKAIQSLSKILLDKYDGKVPKTFQELEALPGIGHKTASVIMCQAFGLPAFPIDTHLHRCAKRWGLSSGKNVATTERDLKKLFPKKSWNKVHLQIIYFAREHCPAVKHNVLTCPICSWCGIDVLTEARSRF